MSKLIEQVTKAKASGYLYISSVVKNLYVTTYYHVVSIEDVLKAGKWIPAQRVQFGNGAWGRQGVTSIHVPDKCISRSRLRFL